MDKKIVRSEADIRLMIAEIERNIAFLEKSKLKLKNELIMQNYAKITALRWVLGEQ